MRRFTEEARNLRYPVLNVRTRRWIQGRVEHLSKRIATLRER